MLVEDMTFPERKAFAIAWLCMDYALQMSRWLRDLPMPEAVVKGVALGLSNVHTEESITLMTEPRFHSGGIIGPGHEPIILPNETRLDPRGSAHIEDVLRLQREGAKG